MTSEQLEASRAERMRLNGLGVSAPEDARTWIEETGLCFFLPRRQFSSFVAPSFVEAVVGQRTSAPDAKQIAQAEDLLVRLEKDDVAVRLNLLGQPSEKPDFVVASWVLPFVYALRGDRDWRRNPQLTGSRQVSPLAVQTYKLLEAGDATIARLKHALGREVTETAVLRAITELWQQLRIIPVLTSPTEPVQWQLLRQRYQKAIAEGASTSQVTAISVLASIYLQAVIAASMEDVELFLAPLTARSKIREVLRGLVATRQVHTLSLDHATQYYVAGTLPEFAAAPTAYASAAVPASNYFLRSYDHEEEPREPLPRPSVPAAVPAPAGVRRTAETHPSHSTSHSASRNPSHNTSRPPAARKPALGAKSASARPHFSRSSSTRDRKPASVSTSGRSARRTGADARAFGARPTGARSENSKHSTTGARWPANSAKNGAGKHNGTRQATPSGNGVRSNGNSANGTSHRAAGSPEARKASPSTAARTQRNGHGNSLSNGHSNGRGNGHGNGLSNGRNKTVKAVGQSAAKARGSRKPALAARTKAGNSKQYGFTAPSRPRTKKRG